MESIMLDVLDLLSSSALWFTLVLLFTLKKGIHFEGSTGF